MQHSLGHEQRQKLMMSTRKLTFLLGTVPIIESDVPPRKDGKLSLSLAPTSASRSLVLRLQSVPSPGLSPQQPPSPLSPTFSTNSPSSLSRSASLAVPNYSASKPYAPPADMFRRKKMAKLTRTLGENIPPELVFPERSSSSRRPLRPRSCSVDSFILIQAASSSPSPQPTNVSFDNLAHSSSEEDLLEKDDKKDSKSNNSSDALDDYAASFTNSVNNSPETSELSPLVKKNAKSSSSQLGRSPSSSSFEHVQPPSHVHISQTDSQTRSVARKTSGFLLRKARRGAGGLDRSASTRSTITNRSPLRTGGGGATKRVIPGRSGVGKSVDLNVQSSYVDYGYVERASSSSEDGKMLGGTTDGTHRKGREWSGQWNVDDMEEVAKKLRGLKAK